MTWFSRFKSGLRRDLPNLAGDIVQIGTETMLEAHGAGSFEAQEIATVVSVAVKDAVAAIQLPNKNREKTDATILRLASPPDPSVSPCWFVYAMPVRQHRVEESVLDVAPRVWLAPQAAWIYAEHVAHVDMGLKKPPMLILADESVVEAADDDHLTRVAWEEWRHTRKSNPRLVGEGVPFGSYVLGELPQGGLVAWRPMLTPRGVRLGTLSEENNCNLDLPPQVFTSENEARKTILERKLSAPVDVLYLPRSLAAEIRADELGELVRDKPRPRIWPGDPVPVVIERRLDRDPDSVLLRPDWYVSRYDGGALAWRPVGDGQVSFARVRRPDGTWGTAVWPSTSKCLKDLGKIGEFAQEHPTMVVTPSPAPKVSQNLSL